MARETHGWNRRIGVAVLVLVAAAFSFLNAGERVSLNIGVTTLYRISLVGLVFAVFLLGMVAMFLFGLSQDRRIRAALHARGSQSSIPNPSPVSPPEPPPVNPPDPDV